MLSKHLFRSSRTPFEEPLEDTINQRYLDSKFFKGAVLVILFVSVLSSLVSYNLVLSKEKDIQKLHAETFDTQMDNIDVRNEVDFIKSLYNVHNKAQSISYLRKPTKIIEVDLKQQSLKIDVEKNYESLTGRIVAGY